MTIPRVNTILELTKAEDDFGIYEASAAIGTACFRIQIQGRGGIGGDCPLNEAEGWGGGGGGFVQSSILRYVGSIQFQVDDGKITIIPDLSDYDLLTGMYADRGGDGIFDITGGAVSLGLDSGAIGYSGNDGEYAGLGGGGSGGNSYSGIGGIGGLSSGEPIPPECTLQAGQGGDAPLSAVLESETVYYYGGGGGGAGSCGIIHIGDPPNIGGAPSPGFVRLIEWDVCPGPECPVDSKTVPEAYKNTIPTIPAPSAVFVPEYPPGDSGTAPEWCVPVDATADQVPLIPHPGGVPLRYVAP